MKVNPLRDFENKEPCNVLRHGDADSAPFISKQTALTVPRRGSAKVADKECFGEVCRPGLDGGAITPGASMRRRGTAAGRPSGKSRRRDGWTRPGRIVDSAREIVAARIVRCRAPRRLRRGRRPGGAKHQQALAHAFPARGSPLETRDKVRFGANSAGPFATLKDPLGSRGPLRTDISSVRFVPPRNRATNSGARSTAGIPSIERVGGRSAAAMI